jgi:formylglycine-generating enzyme required for sulfatase activity
MAPGCTRSDGLPGDRTAQDSGAVSDRPDAGLVAEDAGAQPGRDDAGSPDDAGMARGYVLIPAGMFTMGSPANEVGRRSDEAQHPVTISRAFWLKETEVTQGEWRSRMGSNPSYFSLCGDACPVERVTWFDAVDYLNALSRSVGLEECYEGSGTDRTFAGLSCRGFRLPTEAEWESAARAGTTGATHGALDAIAWTLTNSGGTTHPVRGKEGNAWRLFDVLGNVQEWTQDWYGPHEAAATDPEGPAAGTYRVFRGGSFASSPPYCRAARPFAGDTSQGLADVGLRPARTAAP